MSSVSKPEVSVADAELGTRFLTQSNHKSTTAVRKRAFEPMFDLQRQRFETSMYRISGLSGDEIKQIAQTEIIDKNGTAVIGRGDIFVAVIHKKATLRVVVDEPPPRHAVIIGWPGTRDEGKNERMSLQHELARDAVLQRLDTTPGGL